MQIAAGTGRDRTPRPKRLWGPLSLSNGYVEQLPPESRRLKRAAVSILSNAGFRMRGGVHPRALYDCEVVFIRLWDNFSFTTITRLLLGGVKPTTATEYAR